jgi:Reverse transcriptase (RNA-dependent DNA polymerase)
VSSKIKGMGAFERYKKATPQQLRGGERKLPGYQKIGCHMIFDIKMDGQFTRKARFVANGNETRDIGPQNTYASVVTRESVRIAFLYAALNDLKILGCNVSNAYLNAPCREKIWVDAGPEFGSDEGAVMIVKKALYRLKSSGFSWKKMLTQNLMDMG